MEHATLSAMEQQALWVGMAGCPMPGCPFALRVESDDEGDLDMACMAAFENHAARRHPGMPLDLRSFHQSADTDRRLVN
jgi:hypothetical protein